MKFDMGIFLLEPINYNYQVALPNKFFDFISAGLAVVIGPSPVMASFINEYGFGLVAESFEPKDFAALLNRLDPKDIVRMQQASHRASKIINADTEMNKLIKLYEQVLN